MKIHTLAVKSESGDEYGPFCFTNKLNEQDLKTFLMRAFPDDFVKDEQGPGIFESYLHVKWSHEEIFDSIEDYFRESGL